MLAPFFIVIFLFGSRREDEAERLLGREHSGRAAGAVGRSQDSLDIVVSFTHCLPERVRLLVKTKNSGYRWFPFYQVLLTLN